MFFVLSPSSGKALAGEKLFRLSYPTPEISTQKSDPGRLTGRICLDHVTFRYRVDGPFILDSATVDAHLGESIALVGPSDSSKINLEHEKTIRSVVRARHSIRWL